MKNTRQCEGGGQITGATANVRLKGYRVTCPYCKKSYVSQWIQLGPRGAGYPVGQVIPKHAASR